MDIRAGSLSAKITAIAACLLTVLISALPWSLFCTWAYCLRPALFLTLTGGLFLVSSWFVMKKIVDKGIAAIG